MVENKKKCECCHKEFEGPWYNIPPPPWCFSWEKVCKECYDSTDDKYK